MANTAFPTTEEKTGESLPQATPQNTEQTNSWVNDAWTNMLTSNVQITRAGESNYSNPQVNFEYKQYNAERGNTGNLDSAMQIGGVKEIRFVEYQRIKEIQEAFSKEFEAELKDEESYEDKLDKKIAEAKGGTAEEARIEKPTKANLESFGGNNISQTLTVVKESINFWELFKFVGSLFKDITKTVVTLSYESFKPQKEERKDTKKEDHGKKPLPHPVMRFISEFQKFAKKSKAQEVNPYYFQKPTSYENLVDENGIVSIHAEKQIERAKSEMEKKKEQKASAVQIAAGKGKKDLSLSLEHQEGQSGIVGPNAFKG